MPRQRSQASQQAPKAPGAFLSDGSYSERGEFRHRGHVDQLVRALLKDRRAGSLSPERASMAIQAANATLAFPCHAQWAVSPHWALCQAQSSAESVLVNEGLSDRAAHWCGERYLSGLESDCEDPRHRRSEPPSEFLEAVSRLECHVTLPTEVFMPTSAPDERYFRRQPLSDPGYRRISEREEREVPRETETPPPPSDDDAPPEAV